MATLDKLKGWLGPSMGFNAQLLPPPVPLYELGKSGPIAYVQQPAIMDTNQPPINVPSNIENPPSQDVNDAMHTWKEPQIRCPNCQSVVNGLREGQEKVPLGSPTVTAVGQKKPKFNQDPVTPPVPGQQTQALRLVYRMNPCGCQVSQEWAGAYAAEVLRRRQGKEPKEVVEMTASQKEGRKKSLLKSIGNIYKLIEQRKAAGDMFSAAEIPKLEKELVVKVDQFMRLCPGEHNRLPQTNLSQSTLGWASKNQLALPPKPGGVIPGTDAILEILKAGGIVSATAAAESAGLNFEDEMKLIQQEAAYLAEQEKLHQELMGKFETPKMKLPFKSKEIIAAPSKDCAMAMSAVNNGLDKFGEETMAMLAGAVHSITELTKSLFLQKLADDHNISPNNEKVANALWETAQALHKLGIRPEHLTEACAAAPTTEAQAQKAGYISKPVNPSVIAKKVPKHVKPQKVPHEHPNPGPTTPVPGPAPTVNLSPTPAWSEPGAAIPPVTGMVAAGAQELQTPLGKMHPDSLAALAKKIQAELVAYHSVGAPLSAEAKQFLAAFEQSTGQSLALTPVDPSTKPIPLTSKPPKEPDKKKKEQFLDSLAARKPRRMSKLKQREDD